MVRCQHAYTGNLGREAYQQYVSLQLSWVQGYFSARNVVGHEEKPLTVGGSLNTEEFQKRFREACDRADGLQIIEAADRMYNELQAEGR